MLREQLAKIMEEGFNRQPQRARSRFTDRQWGDVPGPIRALLEQHQGGEGGTVDWKWSLCLFASARYWNKVVTAIRRHFRCFGSYPGVCIRTNAVPLLFWILLDR